MLDDITMYFVAVLIFRSQALARYARASWLIGAVVLAFL
jgi:hypothetical protein